MERIHTATARAREPKSQVRPRAVEQRPRREPSKERSDAAAYTSIAAKTLAGIGIGLLAVMGGAFVLGLAAETVLIPSLLLKAAGGIAGGGAGMAKGIKDTRYLR